MKSLSIPLVAATLAGCAPVAPPEARNPQAEAKLQQVLAGKVPGGAMTCLPPHRANEMITIDDNTILFRRGETVYRNDPVGGCSGLGSGFYTLVTRSSGPGLCRGDIAQVADVSTGMSVGSCSLGDFVPYRPVGG
jgi:hypothetical protein